MAVCFKNVQLYTGKTLSKPQDVYLSEGKWVAPLEPGSYKEIDGTGKMLFPGLTELSACFDLPGDGIVYSLADGIEAMYRGGFKRVVLEPESEEQIDSPAKALYLKSFLFECPLDVQVSSLISKKGDGEQLVEMAELLGRGVTVFSSGLFPLVENSFLRLVMEYAMQLDIRLHLFSLDKSLAGKAQVSEGAYSDLLGMYGVLPQAETIAVYSILQMARVTGCKVHIKHVSIGESFDLITQYAEQWGVDVTCDVVLSNIAFDDSVLPQFNTCHHVTPPLRSKENVAALKIALSKGVVTALSVQHKPVLPEYKNINFEDSEQGCVGLETALAVLNTELGASLTRGILDIVDLFTTGPSKVLDLEAAELSVGDSADLFLWNPNKEWEINRSHYVRRSNSPFIGKKVQGAVEACYFNAYLKEW
ncbi:MAG: amidohydrolase family protein [Fibrobacterales bacterium]